MEKFLFLAGLCFLFFGFSGLFAHGLGYVNVATALLKIAWGCLATVFVYIFKVVLTA